MTPSIPIKPANGYHRHADTLLCADTNCPKRCAPTAGRIADALRSDSDLSDALDLRIAAALTEHAAERFAATAKRMDDIEAKIDQNVEATHRVEESTAGIVELMESWSGAMKTIELTGKLLRPLTWIVGFATAVVGLWAALREVKGG